ncbi:MAG: zf-HC2 domain-containing protein [Streptococcaceae bacterium]|jgi:hypothetical protein|nr:zf-HC2 domain-containing protein [Streptococcaceae bacterium]
MKIPCAVIFDLIPLYKENLCSEETKTFVDEHLKNCKDCQTLFNSYDGEIFEQNSETEGLDNEKSVAMITRINRKLKFKKIIIALVSFIFAILLTLGTYILFAEVDIPVSYEDCQLTVEENLDGSIYFKSGKDFYYLYNITDVVTIDGVEQKVAFIFYTDNVMTKFFSNDQPTKLSAPDRKGSDVYYFGPDIYFNYSGDYLRFQMSADISPENFKLEEVSRVYYLDGDYTSLTDFQPDHFKTVPDDAILIWKR